jgi:hypothetical protein
MIHAKNLILEDIFPFCRSDLATSGISRTAVPLDADAVREPTGRMTPVVAMH